MCNCPICPVHTGSGWSCRQRRPTCTCMRGMVRVIPQHCHSILARVLVEMAPGNCKTTTNCHRPISADAPHRDAGSCNSRLIGVQDNEAKQGAVSNGNGRGTHRTTTHEPQPFSSLVLQSSGKRQDGWGALRCVRQPALGLLRARNLLPERREGDCTSHTARANKACRPGSVDRPAQKQRLGTARMRE